MTTEPIDGSVQWVRCSRLRAVGPAEPAWVSASRVYLDDTETNQIAVPASTGLACHPDPWRAVQSALLEVIQRDAVMIMWLTRAAAIPLNADLRWVGRRGNAVRFDRAAERYELYLLDSPTRVPVVFAVAFGSDQQPGAAVGAAAHLDLPRACRDALVEARQTMHWATHMMTDGRARSAGDEQLDLDDHVAYYLDHARIGAFDFLRDSGAAPQAVDLSTVGADVEPEVACRRLVGQAADAGLDCFAVDVTSPEVRAAGLWVVRAEIPGLYPLLVGTENRPDHPRLAADAPANPDPHPFP